MIKKSKDWEEKKEQVNRIVDNMDKAVEEHFASPYQLKEYLTFMSKFREYSPRNTSLIKSQFRGAEAVGSFNFWKDKGFSVKKGEKGIQILVPNQTAPKFKDENGKWKNIKYATKDEQEKIKNGVLENQKSKLYFSIGHVFDVSQTNAKASDLPDIYPNKWLEGQVSDYGTMIDSLYKIARDMDVSVGSPFEELGSAKGVYYHPVDATNRGHIGLNPRNSQLQNVKTMIHELAHAKLHYNRQHTLSDAEKEFQAEMVAFSTSSYFGIDTSEYSLGYLSNWTKGKELKEKDKLLNEVRQTTIEFIDVIEKDLLLNRELENVLNNDMEQIEERKYTMLEYENFGSMQINQYTREEIEGRFLYGESLISVQDFNKQHKERYTLIDPEQIQEPFIVVKWSESNELSSNELIPYPVANEITTKLANSIDYGYDKTWYTILIPDSNGEMGIISMDRLDSGDGQYMNIHDQVKSEMHLYKDFSKELLTERQWEILENSVHNTSKEITKSEINRKYPIQQKTLE